MAAAKEMAVLDEETLALLGGGGATAAPACLGAEWETFKENVRSRRVPPQPRPQSASGPSPARRPSRNPEVRRRLRPFLPKNSLLFLAGFVLCFLP
jgi:hypothetical protein